MKKIIYFSILLLLLGLSSNAYAQMRSNVTNILTEDNNLDGWIDAFDVYITNSIDDYPGGDTDWAVLNAAGINTDFIVGGSYALTIDSLNTGEFIGDDIFRCHISMPSNVGTGFIGDITLSYISNSARRIWDIYDTYLETFTPQPVFDGASPLLYELNTFDERGRDDYVDKIKVYFTESLNPAWFPHGSYPPGTIFHFTDDIFVDAILEHAGFETTIFPNDTYVMDITNATTLNNGNSTIGYVPMLPRLNFTNTMAACPWALRDLFSNLAVYGGGPYITEAITKEASAGADTYIDVTFSSSIDDLTVDFSDFEVVLDGVGQTILSIAVAGPVLTLEVAGIPHFLSGINRLRLTSTYCIADILGDENIVITWVNIKDGISPSVLSLTPDPELITDADVGPGNFELEVVYNEDMDTGTDPTIVFTPDVSSTLTNPTPSWTNATTFVMTYDVADAGVDVDDIDITVDDAEDVAGNTQYLYNEADVFSIATKNPEVTNLTPNPELITDADVGTNTFTLTVDYDEAMDMGTNPTITFPVEDPTNTITFNYGAWSDADTYVAYYDVGDVNETIWDIDVYIVGAMDDPGENTQEPYDEADVFSIDTENPEVVTITPAPVLIADADVGTNTFTLTVDYNEDMDTGTDPIITFPVEDPTNTITFNYGSWSDADTYVAYYDVADVDETIWDIDVHIEGAIDDPGGNLQEPYDEADVFDIDTENPVVTGLTPDPVLITDFDTTRGTFTLTVEYSGTMDTGTDPTITFPVEDPTNTITFNYGTWSYTDTYVAYYDVVDVGETVLDIDVHIEGAKDDPAGNTQVPYDEADVFSIDTENPFVTNLTPYPDYITAVYVGTNTFTLTVDYSEDMDTGTNPTITFPDEDPLTTITFNHGTWSDADTYVAYYDVVDVDDIISDIDVHIEGAKDDPAGNTQVPYDESKVFSINTDGPEVTNLTPNPVEITDSDVGPNNFTLAVDYDKAMVHDGTADPVITFPVEDPLNTIEFNHGEWFGSYSSRDECYYYYTYVAYYNVHDTIPPPPGGETVPDIDVHIEGAKAYWSGNLQDPYDEPDVFSIDTENPVVVLVTPDPALITDADAGTSTFCLTIDYSEAVLTDGTADPIITFPVEDPTNTITFNNGTWSDSDTYVACYDVADVGETVPDIDVHIAGALDDPAGNTQVPYDEADVFSIDTENPTVTTLTVDTDPVYDEDLTQCVTVTYSDRMGITSPIITFDCGTWTTDGDGAWSGGNVWTECFTLTDNDEVCADVETSVSGAKDAAGNLQVPYTETTNVFDIDTHNPTVTTLTVDTDPVYDEDLTQFVEVTYSEPMMGTPIPIITFNHGTWTTNGDGAWTGGNVWTETFTLTDNNEEFEDVETSVSGAKDAAGNLQIPYTATTVRIAGNVFDIDTMNPIVSSLTVDTDPVYEGDLTQFVTVTYSESMMGAPIPIITFEHGTWTTVSDGAWSGGNVWTETFTLTDNDEEFADVETSVSGAKDAAGNLQVPYTETTNVFDIDTIKPIVSTLTVDTDPVYDEDLTQFVTVTYSEPMGTTSPAITFDHGTWTTVGDGAWSGGNVWTETFTLTDNDEEFADVETSVSGAKDAAGNDQVPYTETTNVFDIDTMNPIVSTLTVDTDPVYEGDLTQFVTVTYNEPMGTTSPAITFEHGTWTTVGDGAWSGGNVWTETFTLTDNDEEFADVETSVSGAKDTVGNLQVPYTETTNVFVIDTIKPIVSTLTVDTDPVYEGDLTQFVTVTYSEPMGTTSPAITFEHGTWTTNGDGAWSGGNVWTETFTLTDNDEEFADVETSVSGAKDAAGNDQVPYTETTNVFVIDTVKPISSVLTAIYNSTTGCIDVAWEASDTNGIEQVELYVNIDGGGFSLADTDITGNTTGTFSYCLDPNPVCEEGTYEFYTIATDVPGNVETDLDPIVPVVVDIIASGFIITTTPESPELGTYFDVNVAAVDDAGMLDCEYSNIIHFLSNYPDDVTLPDEPLLSNGYQVYGNCISFEAMDDLVIEAYGIYPFENYSYSDPIVIQPPTIAPPTNTAAHDVLGDEGGWIYIDYELSLNDPFHSATEMPSINYYVVETNTNPIAVFNVYITCDNYPSETTWEVVEDGVGVLYSGGPYSTPGQVVDVDCILTNGDYTFTIYDSFGDGICCTWGIGHYILTLNGSFIGQGGAFGSSESTSFTVTGAPAGENWQAFAEVYLYDPPVGDSASVILQVPNGFVEYEYRMAAVYNLGYQSSDGGDAIESQISNQRDQGEGPLVIYLRDPVNRDLSWQSEWAYCGAAAGSPEMLSAPVITNIYIESGNVYIEWGAVDGATSYTVYSDTDPYGSFTTVEEAGITDSSWNEPVVENKFYRVTASN